MSMHEDKNSENTNKATKANVGFFSGPACSLSRVKVTLLEDMRFAKKPVRRIWSALQAARGEAVENSFKIVALLRKALSDRHVNISQPGKPYGQKAHPSIRGPNSKAP